MRNPDYEFISTDVSALEASLTANYEAFSGESVMPASPEMLIIRWAASIILQERALLNYTANQNIPSRAEGENLDALAELFFARQRTGAQAANCIVRFYISQVRTSATLIPAGTRVTDASQSLYWETLADGYVRAGSTYVDLPVQCQTPGVIGNGWIAGQINTIVDVYDFYHRCENITESDGGADAMTDEELYESMRLSMDALSTAGARGSYIYHAKAVSTEIADVAVSSPAPGEVRIFALMQDGSIAGETMKQMIYAACNADNVRPLTDHVEMADPEIVRYQIDLTYWIPSDSSVGSGSIENAVHAAIDEFIQWQGAKLGRDINPSRLISLLMQTGIKRVEIRSPVFTKLNDGSDENTPQIASVLTEQGEKNLILVNGGPEDE